MSAPRFRRYADGPEYTRKGENVSICRQKAYAFKRTWPNDTSVIDTSALARPDEVTADIAWDAILALYDDEKKMVWVNKCVAAGLNVLTCTEDQVREFLMAAIYGADSDMTVRTKSYLLKICSHLRVMFRRIGREHAWGDGEALKPFETTLVFTGNPMTSAIQTILVDELKKQKKEAVEAGVEIAEGRGKMGFPMSIVLAYMIFMWNLSQTVVWFVAYMGGRLTCSKKIVNLAYLTLLQIMLMHEGSRNSELEDNLSPQHVYAIAHARVPWLVFVFLNAETLAYILNGNYLSRFAFIPFKGKSVKATAGRVMAVKPVAYGSLDMMTMYVLIMRMIYTISPAEMINRFKVFRDGLDLTGVRSRRQNAAEIKDATLYSYRIAGAEEDKIGRITEAWTRRRMGHSAKSNMKDMYAENHGKRVTVGGADTKLGMDVCDEVTGDGIILEYIPINEGGIVFDNDWIAETFADKPLLQEDFVVTMNRVTEFIEFGRDADQDWLWEKLQGQWPKARRVGEVGWLKDFPLGTHIALHPDLLLAKDNKFRTEYDMAMEKLSATMGAVERPKNVPELWSFPQVMYGNWRRLLDPTFVTGTGLTNKRKAGAESSKTAADPDPEETHDDDDHDDDELITVDWIEPWDHIIIACFSPKDKCALGGIEGHEGKYVWIARVNKVKLLEAKGKKANEEKRAEITANFYYNATKDIRAPLKMKQQTEVMVVKDSSMVDLFGTKKGEAVVVTAENIATIKAFMCRVP